MPIFTKPKFTIRVSNYLRNKISRQILETKIQNQHVKEKKLTWQLKGSFNHIKKYSVKRKMKMGQNSQQET